MNPGDPTQRIGRREPQPWLAFIPLTITCAPQLDPPMSIVPGPEWSGYTTRCDSEEEESSTYLGVSLGDTFDEGRLGPAMAYGQIDLLSDPTWMPSVVAVWVSADTDQRELLVSCLPGHTTEYVVWHAIWPEAE